MVQDKHRTVRIAHFNLAVVYEGFTDFQEIKLQKKFNTVRDAKRLAWRYIDMECTRGEYVLLVYYVVRSSSKVS